MKAEPEVEKVEFRGVLLESEDPEEKAILEGIWFGHGRAVALERLLNGQVKLVVAPTPQGEERPACSR